MLQSASLHLPGNIVLKRDWLTLTEIANRLGVNRTTVWRWLDSGRLKLGRKVTPGGRTLYSRADLETWLKSPDADTSDRNT